MKPTLSISAKVGTPLITNTIRKNASNLTYYSRKQSVNVGTNLAYINTYSKSSTSKETFLKDFIATVNTYVENNYRVLTGAASVTQFANAIHDDTSWGKAFPTVYPFLTQAPRQTT